MIDFEDFKRSIRNVKSVGKGYTGLCPAHDDNRNSLSFQRKGIDGIEIFCHRGCDWRDVLRSVGMWEETPKNPNNQNNQPKKPRKIIAEYDFVDEEGELLYQEVKYDPKDFSQRRPDGEGWVYSIKGVRRVPYNLPQLLQRPDETVYITEGPKDADRLMQGGLLASTNVSGAGKWRKEYNRFFKNRNVVIVPDNDDKGREHANIVAKNLVNGAKSIKILDLPDLNEKQDISDWLELYTITELEVLVSQTPLYEYDGEFEEEMPYDLEAEGSVLGAILKDGKYMPKAIETNLQQSIYAPPHKNIYKAMFSCFQEGKSVDIITVSDRLKLDGTYEKVGGIEYLKKLKQEVPESMAVEHWINIIVSKAQLRSLIALGDKVKSSAYIESDSPENLSNDLVKTVFDIKATQKREGFISLGRLVDNVLVDARDQVATGITGLPTGFHDLDVLTSGLQKSDLIIVAARPSMGKTAGAINIASHIAIRENKNVAVFSLEMDKKALVRRIVCAEAMVDAQAFRNGTLTSDDWARIADILPDLESAGLYIDDTPAISVPELRAKLFDLLTEKEELDLVVVDYLQLMTGSRSENRQQEVSQISRDLKSIAKEFNVPLMALSQLSRAPETRSDHRPLMSDLRESGSIEQDADLVIFQYRDEYYNPNENNKGMAEWIIGKARNGPLGTVDLGFIGQFNKFENLIQR